MNLAVIVPSIVGGIFLLYIIIILLAIYDDRER